MDYLVGEEGLPIKRACGYLGLASSSYYQRPASRAKVDDPVIEVLNQVLAKNGRWGFRLCFDWMRMHGYEWNHKQVWRIYKEVGLNLPRRTKNPEDAKSTADCSNPTEQDVGFGLYV